MTSAEVPRMKLEHTVELSGPITDLAVSAEDRANPLIMVMFEGARPPEIVAANTGTLSAAREHALWRGTPDMDDTLFLADVMATATINGSEIVLHGDDGGIQQLSGHSTPIATLGRCPSADGELLLSGSDGGTIRLWNPQTGQQLRLGEPAGRTAVLHSYIGSDGSPRIVSGSKTGTLRIWNPRLKGPLRIGSVSTRGFSDRVAVQDLLNRTTLVSALAEVLDPCVDDGPSVITIEGAWGSGKSTVLEFVRSRLTEKHDNPPQGRKLTVFGADRMLRQPPAHVPSLKQPNKRLVVSFNPWRHQSSEQVWAGLAQAVAASAESAIMPDPKAKERYWFARNAHKVDRRHLQRQLWKRIYSPLLSFAGLGFGLSLLAQLTKMNVSWAWVATATLATLGVLHTGKRYFWDRASSFLPGELFGGPVTSNAFAGPITDPLIRDPYYHAKSGYLYLVQHDVKTLLEDLSEHGYQVVLLIDDLDRCTPRTTAQVFEAINVFLSDDFPATRFVLGLDTSVVSSHVDHAYKELADAKIVTHVDDPSPGWTFLRKLVQLPVRLPRTTEENVDQVLLAHLGPVHTTRVPTPRKRVSVSDANSVSRTATLIAWSRTAEAEQTVIAIERHAEVREHLRRRLKAQPEQSVREEKRLLNIWQFYLRVLGSVDVQQACHLVAVAEIATRWPAYLHRVRGGWQELADAVGDDVQWGATVAKLGFAYSDRKASANLRELLQDCDAQAVAGLANRLF